MTFLSTAGEYWLESLTRDNYDAVMSMCVSPEQERFVGTVAEAIAHAHFDANKHLLALYWRGFLVGFAMYTDTHEVNGQCRLSRFLVHCTEQGKGHGHHGVRLVIAHILSAHPTTTLHVLVNSANTVACHLYESAGFAFDKAHPMLPSDLKKPQSNSRGTAAAGDVWLGVLKKKSVTEER